MNEPQSPHGGSPQHERPSAIPGLDGFRALAFAAVFSYHVSDGAGYLGVPAFFVLSGYLITRTLVDQLSGSRGAAYFGRFYVRRTARILPLYLAYLGFVSALVFLRGVPAPIHALEQMLPWSLTYTLNIFGAMDHPAEQAAVPYLAHLWSLSVEEQFYLLWPWVVYFVPARARRASLLGIICAGPFLRIVERLWIAAYPQGWNTEWDLALYLLTPSHLDAFAMGAYFSLYGEGLRWRRHAVLVALVAAIVLGFVTEYITTQGIFARALGFAPFMRDSFKYVWGYTLINLLSAQLIVSIQARQLAPRLFEHPLLMRVGRISYGLYVFHVPALLLTRELLPTNGNYLRNTIGLVATLLISALSFRYFERHAMAWGRRLSP
jgi:peptidoglycan/LPS O-acetylase OafA/YrhL